MRDRAFFFFGIEQNYLRVPFVVEFAAPPAGVNVPGDILALEGEQNGTNDPTALFGRTDFVLSDANTLNVQYTYTRLRGENFNFDSPRINEAVSTNFTRIASSNGLKTSLVSVVNPSIVNEVRFQVATDNRLEEPNSNLPALLVPGFGDFGGDNSRPRLFDTMRFQLADNFSVNAGAHRLRFGVDTNINRVRQQRESNTQGRFDFESRGGASALQNFIANRPRRFRQSVPGFDPEDLIFRGSVKELALFVQDRVEVTRHVTLNAGLRWASFFNLDVRLLKGFRLGETRRLDFSAEVFNLTRNTNKNFGNDSISEFGTPDDPVSTAGEALFAPSTARFGGPRQLQLGVRFVF